MKKLPIKYQIRQPLHGTISFIVLLEKEDRELVIWKWRNTRAETFKQMKIWNIKGCTLETNVRAWINKLSRENSLNFQNV